MYNQNAHKPISLCCGQTNLIDFGTQERSPSQAARARAVEPGHQEIPPIPVWWMRLLWLAFWGLASKAEHTLQGCENTHMKYTWPMAQINADQEQCFYWHSHYHKALSHTREQHSLTLFLPSSWSRLQLASRAHTFTFMDTWNTSTDF